MAAVIRLNDLKYKIKLKTEKKRLWMLSVVELIDELKQSLSDLKEPLLNPDLDSWIDQVTAVIVIKCTPNPKDLLN